MNTRRFKSILSSWYEEPSARPDHRGREEPVSSPRQPDRYKPGKKITVELDADMTAQIQDLRATPIFDPIPGGTMEAHLLLAKVAERSKRARRARTW